MIGWVPRVLVAAGLVFGAWTGSAPDELLQGTVRAVDAGRRTIELQVYLEGTDVPRAASRLVVVSVDEHTRFRPGPAGVSRLRRGDDVLVRVGGDGRAGEVTVLDLE